MVHHLAIVTTETLPRFPQPCAGGGVRIWGLGERLRKRGVQCTYFIPLGTPGLDDAPAEVPLIPFKSECLHDAIRESGCDAVLFEQWQPLTFLRETLEIPIAVDLPGPLTLEYFWRDRDNFYQHITDKVNALSRADYFICAHERQLGYYAAWLTWAGIAPDAERLAVVPFLFEEMPRSRQGFVEDEPLLFWGGMFWPWHERSKAFETILETLTRHRQGQLVVAGSDGHEEHARVNGKSYADHPHTTWLGRLCFSEYVTELKRAAVAVDLCHPTEERRLSSDLRTGTSLWAGVPCLVTPESPWANWIQQENAGWVIPYSDEKRLTKLVKEIVLERGDIVARRRGARTISEKISDGSGIKPFLNWLKNPTKRTPGKPFFDARFQDREARVQAMRDENDLLRHQRDTLQDELDSIRSNPLFRLYKRLTFGK